MMQTKLTRRPREHLAFTTRPKYIACTKPFVPQFLSRNKAFSILCSSYRSLSPILPHSFHPLQRMAFDPSSSTQPTHQARNLRRRSADVGGLLLATGNNGQGHGWMGVQTDNIDGEITYVHHLFPYLLAPCANPLIIKSLALALPSFSVRCIQTL